MPKAQLTLQVWYYCHIVVKIVLKSHFGTFMTLRYFTRYLVNFQYCIKNKVQGNILRDCKHVSDIETYMDYFAEEVVKILNFSAISSFSHQHVIFKTSSNLPKRFLGSDA